MTWADIASDVANTTKLFDNQYPGVSTKTVESVAAPIAPQFSAILPVHATCRNAPEWPMNPLARDVAQNVILLQHGFVACAYTREIFCADSSLIIVQHLIRALSGWRWWRLRRRHRG